MEEKWSDYLNRHQKVFHGVSQQKSPHLEISRGDFEPELLKKRAPQTGKKRKKMKNYLIGAGLLLLKRETENLSEVQFFQFLRDLESAGKPTNWDPSKFS